MSLLVAGIIGYVIGVATPYGKKLITQIIVGAYTKAKKEIDRWFK